MSRLDTRISRLEAQRASGDDPPLRVVFCRDDEPIPDECEGVIFVRFVEPKEDR